MANGHRSIGTPGGVPSTYILSGRRGRLIGRLNGSQLGWLPRSLRPTAWKEESSRYSQRSTQNQSVLDSQLTELSAETTYGSSFSTSSSSS